MTLAHGSLTSTMSRLNCVEGSEVTREVVGQRVGLRHRGKAIAIEVEDRDLDEEVGDLARAFGI